MAFSWTRPSVSLAEALVGPGFGRGSSSFAVGDTNIITQTVKKVTQAINEESFKKLKILLSSIDASELKSVVNSKDSNGRTPLMLTCFVKDASVRQRMTDFLLRHGADANLVDEEGRSALCHAAILNLLDVIQVLIACSRIDPNVADKQGNTPLIYSVKNGNDLAVRLLVRSFHRFGVLKVDAKNNAGETALTIAANNRLPAIASVLVNSGKASLDIVLPSGETVLKVLQKEGFAVHKSNINGEWKFDIDESSTCSTPNIESLSLVDSNSAQSMTPNSKRRSSFEASSRVSICETGNANI